MKRSNHLAKLYLMHLPPVRVYQLLDEYKIPSPHKEVLILTCVEKLDRYPAMHKLKQDYNIYISFWQFGDRLRDGLSMFAETHKMMKRDYSSELLV